MTSENLEENAYVDMAVRRAVQYGGANETTERLGQSPRRLQSNAAIGQHLRDVRPQCKRPVEALDSLCVTLDVQQCHSALDVRLCLPGQQFGGALERCQRLVVAAQCNQRGTSADQVRSALLTLGGKRIEVPQRFSVSPQQRINDGAIVQDLGIPRFEREPKRVTLRCFRQTLEGFEGVAPLRVQGGLVGLQGECALEAVQRAFMLSLARQQHGEVVMGRGQVRVERGGAFKALHCLALASDGGQRPAQIRVATGILECETHGLAGVGERLVVSTESREHRGARAVASRQRLIQGERAIAGAQSFFFPPERVQRLREIEENRSAVRLQLQGSGEQGCSFRMTSELSQRHAE